MADRETMQWEYAYGGLLVDGWRMSGYRCSACGKGALNKTNYCPNCGRKWVGARNEGKT